MVRVVQKKVILLAISVAVAMSLFSGVVFAAISFPPIVYDVFESIFITLPEGLKTGQTWAFVYMKFLLFFALFSVVFFGAKKVFSDQSGNRIAIVVSIIVSIIGVIGIPNDWLLFIYGEYVFVAMILIILAPIIAGLAVIGNVPDEMAGLKALLWGLLAFLLGMAAGHVGALNVASSIIGSSAGSAASSINAVTANTAGGLAIASIIALFMMFGYLLGSKGIGSSLFNPSGNQGDGAGENQNNTPQQAAAQGEDDAANLEQVAAQQEQDAIEIAQLAAATEEITAKIDETLRARGMDTDRERNAAYNYIFRRPTTDTGALTDEQKEYLDTGSIPEGPVSEVLRQLFSEYLGNLNMLHRKMLELRGLDAASRTRIMSLIRNPLVSA